MSKPEWGDEVKKIVSKYNISAGAKEFLPNDIINLFHSLLKQQRYEIISNVASNYRYNVEVEKDIGLANIIDWIQQNQQRRRNDTYRWHKIFQSCFIRDGDNIFNHSNFIADNMILLFEIVARPLHRKTILKVNLFAGGKWK